MFKTEFQSTALLAENASRPASSLGLTEIAGYRLEQRIGVGGFGEVWKAVGPGGFLKAVKILFGNLTGPQAETELKSLSRMRELRHPFLLNIERVEVSDGRVIVVSELADRSLEDRYREAVSGGLRGIPRDELIGYLRDAADALDFMSEQHGLQHLDIKPENLLLQGNHAKVGDFGLTKSLTAVGHSMVNGFTPLYAPPELFDGRPDRGSDQYSLAIVYQMMLTGQPPFNGRSAAQLTSQHLKSPPDLTALHPSDRAVVARALSKNPRTRFASCRQFIDELARRRFASPSGNRSANPVEPSPESTLTALVDAGTVATRKSRLLPPVIPLRPPTDVKRENWFARPTVFVGVGGLGIRAVEMLQEKLHHTFPNATLPAVRFLCIDADSEVLDAVTRRTTQGIKSSLETICTPLRSSHDYRKSSNDHLSWLSRRWLFNIPRSGKVEGMRPLGRLAFVDHEENVRRQIEKNLDVVFRPDSIQTMANETKLSCSLDGIDFVVIGATSGGSSSGCLIDVGFLIKSIIAEKRLPPCQVSAFLLHGTSNGRQAADMQDANTLSFLKELQYFNLPGVQRVISKGRSVSGAPFDAAWMLHLGDDLTSLEYNRGLNSLSQYLELRTMSPARCDMDAWKAAESQSGADHSEMHFRTFGLSVVESDMWEMANGEAGRICAALVNRWLSSDTVEKFGNYSQASPELVALISELSLTSEGVIDLMPRLLNSDRSRRIDEYAASLAGRVVSSGSTQDIPGTVAALLTHDTAAHGQENPITSVIESIRRDLSSGMNQSFVRIERHVLQCLDGRGRFAAAERDLRLLLASVETAVATSGRQKSDLQQAFTDLCDSMGKPSVDGPSAGMAKAFSRQYCMLLVCQTVCQNISNHLKTLREYVSRYHSDQLAPLRARIQTLASKLSSTTSSVPDPILQGFETFLLSGDKFQLSSLRMREASASDVSMLTSLGANFLFLSAGGAAAEKTQATPDSFPAASRPVLRNVGGGQRVLAALPALTPEGTWKSALVNEFGQCVSIVPMERRDITVVCETEGIAVSTVLESISQLKPEIEEIANRVHSRQDIQW